MGRQGRCNRLLPRCTTAVVDSECMMKDQQPEADLLIGAVHSEG